jgi:non-ribosomal peptide synthetase-like protein
MTGASRSIERVAGRGHERPETLSEVFARAVERFPDACAVDVPPGSGRPERATRSYRELADDAARIAVHLGASSPERTVAILLGRDTPWLYASWLGALAAGVAYVGLEPSFPDAHLRVVLADCGADVILTDAAGYERARSLAGGIGPVPRVVDVTALPDGAGSLPLPAETDRASRLAYLIYTSGTTGRPKGVMVEQRSIVALVLSDLAEFGLGPGDRVAQGSSPAYDSSVEEAWLALASGATVVPLDDEAVRLGPDLVRWLREERINVLCPPPTLLRTTGCQDPAAELPDLRLLYVGGEALPQELADRWARGRRMVNGYGPTECTVTVTRAEVVPGRPVRIGRPVEGSRAHVLDEAGSDVAPGEWGELCFSGACLARGYLGLPERTAEVFVDHPVHGRIYRTGDRARIGDDGALEYGGRLDAQVKIRGHRVELADVEARLAECEGVRAAACSVRAGVLVAFVVPERVLERAEFEAVVGSAVERLRGEVPSHMVPARFALLAAVPTTIGGKVDRRAVDALGLGDAVSPAPSVGRASEGAGRGRRTAAGAVEEVLAAVWQRVLELDAVPLDVDFFDLGGDSVRAAELVSALRLLATTGDDSGLAGLTVRDVYTRRTVEALARRAEERAACAVGDGTQHDEVASRAAASPPRVGGESREPESRGEDPSPFSSPGEETLGAEREAPRLAPSVVTTLQTGWILLELATGAAAAWFSVFVALPWLLDALGVVTLLVVGAVAAPLLTLAAFPFVLGLAVCGKRALIGRYRPGRYRVWSLWFVRHWIVQRLVQLVPWAFVEGTELQCLALRALGARIGREVRIERGVSLLAGGWDLLEIGDRATLARDAGLGLCALDAGAVVVAPVLVGEDAVVEVRGYVEGGVRVGAGARVTALSSAECDVADGAIVDGVPAVVVDPRIAHAGGVDRASTEPSRARPVEAEAISGGPALSPFAHTALVLASRSLVALALWIPAAVILLAACLQNDLDAAAIEDWLSAPTFGPGLLVWLLAFALLPPPAALLLRALALRFGPRVPAGAHRARSALDVLADVRSRSLEAAGTWLSGTVFWPAWLRLAGARIGRRSEISTITDVLPEHLTVGADSFFADGIYLGAPDAESGLVRVAPTRLGDRVFLGNHVVVRSGASIPDGVLLGLCTVADGSGMAPDSSWFGHPPFVLPRREVVAAASDLAQTFAPGPLRRVNRVFWELLRFAIPLAPAAALVAWFELAASPLVAPNGPSVLSTALATLVVAAALAASVVALKWLLLGRVRPGQHGLWSCWCSRWDFLYVVWFRIARPVLARLAGTLWLAAFLRTTGVRVGRRVVLGPGFAQVVDPDMLAFGDDAVIDTHFQAHTFEDRVLKIDRVEIGAGATLRHGSVVQYGAVLGSRSRVAPNSVVMKHERLLPDRRYAGAPTAEVARRGAAHQVRT